ncbi:MAG: hypothetical protein PWQ29_1644 [Verrucomicrobiota bacterium]|jgi:hypothetical protein|nr:hypothetical protein [Verrucomicrobiota bacterium]
MNGRQGTVQLQGFPNLFESNVFLLLERALNLPGALWIMAMCFTFFSITCSKKKKIRCCKQFLRYVILYLL